jgi:hypothetical protein
MDDERCSIQNYGDRLIDLSPIFPAALNTKRRSGQQEEILSVDSKHDLFQ